MKMSFIIGFVVLSSTSFAKMTTQDNLNYMVTIQDTSVWKQCSKLVCNIAKIQGNGNKSCHKFPTIGIVGVNLTTKGLDMLRSVSSCELVIEEEGEVEAQPKLGTSN